MLNVKTLVFLICIVNFPASNGILLLIHSPFLGGTLINENVNDTLDFNSTSPSFWNKNLSDEKSTYGMNITETTKPQEIKNLPDENSTYGMYITETTKLQDQKKVGNISDGDDAENCSTCNEICYHPYFILILFTFILF